MVSEEQTRQKKHHDRNLPAAVKVNVGEKVWLRDFIIKKETSKKFHQPWKGPYEVVKIVGENNLEINLGGTKRVKTKRVNLEHVKKADEIDGNPDDIVKVMDKMRTRLPGQRLVTRYFVEFANGNTQWVDADFVPDALLENFY